MILYSSLGPCEHIGELDELIDSFYELALTLPSYESQDLQPGDFVVHISPSKQYLKAMFVGAIMNRFDIKIFQRVETYATYLAHHPSPSSLSPLPSQNSLCMTRVSPFGPDCLSISNFNHAHFRLIPKERLHEFHPFMATPIRVFDTSPQHPNLFL